jgi:Putative phage tail protein
MARLTFYSLPLSPARREEAELAPGQRAIDWLQEHYPNGCGAPVRYWLNGEELELDDLDAELEADDSVILAASPGWAAIGIAILTSIIVSALTLAITLLFIKKPSAPGFAASNNQDNRMPSTVYDIRVQANAARLGEVIPVCYGTVLTTPDYAMQPHRWYDGNRDVYVDLLYVLSQGEVDVHQVLVGDTPTTAIEPSSVSYAVVYPWQHQQQAGRLGFHSNFYENVVTCPEVGGQEFTGPAQFVGYFRLSKTGQRGRYIEIDLEWPQGLWRENTWGGGGISDWWVEWIVSIIPCDIDGNFIGPAQNYYFHESTFIDNDPLRKTYAIDGGSSQYWVVGIERTSPIGPGTTMDRFIWTGLKLYADFPNTPMYGNVTLLAMRLKGSGAISDREQQIRVRMTRRLNAVDNAGTWGATANPADAFLDIYTNMSYGARRPKTEVDLNKLAQLRTLWSGYQFSCVYTSATTVWEALTQAVQGMAAAPVPIGSFLSVAQDGIKPARSMLFTEQNIATDTFQISYEFDKVGANDGVEIEFRDPANFAPSYARVPSSSVDPEKIVLFGCVDATHAAQFAQLTWNRRQVQRQTITFETELEGLIPALGERVAVSNTLPFWGVSGFVSAWDAGQQVVTLDRPLPWDDYAPGPYLMAFRDAQGRPSEVVPVGPYGTGFNQAWLPRWPLNADGVPLDFHIGDRQEQTHFVFGTPQTLVRDFVMAEIAPRGGVRVGLSGSVYNPNIFPGTLAFLAGPVP